MHPSVDTLKFDPSTTVAPFTTIYRTSSSTALVDRNRLHYHPDTVEICAILRGHQDWTVGDQTYALLPGDALIVPPNVVHGSVDSNLQPCDLVAVHLAPEALPPRLTELALSFTERRFRQPAIIEMLQQVIDVHERRDPFLPEVAGALAVLLMTSLASLDEEDEQKNSRLVRQAQRAMMGKNGVRPTLAEVAERLGVSSVWLTRLFVRETGASPGAWARAKRFSEAKRLIEAGRLSTVEIAMHLGYSSGQSFATAFRQESGMTPSEYRELHSQGTEHAPTIYCVNPREIW